MILSSLDENVFMFEICFQVLQQLPGEMGGLELCGHHQPQVQAQHPGENLFDKTLRVSSRGHTVFLGTFFQICIS
jgi:hypothetical protein